MHIFAYSLRTHDLTTRLRNVFASGRACWNMMRLLCNKHHSVLDLAAHEFLGTWHVSQATLNGIMPQVACSSKHTQLQAAGCMAPSAIYTRS
jgi:hypothetical protein